jgi:hypothetical protein
MDRLPRGSDKQRTHQAAIHDKGNGTRGWIRVVFGVGNIGDLSTWEASWLRKNEILCSSRKLYFPAWKGEFMTRRIALRECSPINDRVLILRLRIPDMPYRDKQGNLKRRRTEITASFLTEEHNRNETTFQKSIQAD